MVDASPVIPPTLVGNEQSVDIPPSYNDNMWKIHPLTEQCALNRRVAFWTAPKFPAYNSNHRKVIFQNLQMVGSGPLEVLRKEAYGVNVNFHSPLHKHQLQHIIITISYKLSNRSKTHKITQCYFFFNHPFQIYSS